MLVKEDLQNNAKVRHVALIMDGNGRWAQSRGLPRNEGHRRGVDNVRRILEGAADLNLDYLTLYAFSCENWKRPKEEVDALMGLLERFLTQQAKTLHKHQIRLRTIGRIEELPPRVTQLLTTTCAETAHYTRWTLVIALNYGSRSEVVDAVRAWHEAVREGREFPEDLDWERFSHYLQTRDIPDPDLIIRTSGETRVSNFLLLQGAYAELYFSPKLWPDFGPGDLAEAMAWYRTRERRFGMTGEQVRQASPTTEVTMSKFTVASSAAGHQPGNPPQA